MIKLSRAYLDQTDEMAVIDAMQQGYLGMGVSVKKFEESLTAFLQTRQHPVYKHPFHVACVNTGTSALHLALQAAGVGPGDQVLVPTLTYVASFQAISATGAIPVATDVDPITGFMDYQDTQNRLTPHTKAIMPVYYGSGYGQGDNSLAKIYELAKIHNLRVIEDAAHAFGNTIHPHIPHDILCYSFDGIKNITCSEGGAVVSTDKALIDRVADLRLLGVMHDTEKRYQGARSFDFEVTKQGWRYHMSNMNGALGHSQLQKIHQFSEKRRTLHKIYCKHLDPAIGAPIKIDLDHCVPHIFVLLVKDAAKRDSLRAHLYENGIETGLHYKPNHLLAKYKTDYRLPVAEDLWDRMVTLPLHCHMTTDDVHHICHILGTYS